MKQVHVLFAGHVQGVGFRYTTVDMARDFRVTGWVRNLRDGRVELLAEGEERELNAFLDQVRDGPLRHYIADVQVSWAAASGRYDGFATRPTADGVFDPTG